MAKRSMTKGQFKDFIKWGTVFPKGVLKPMKSQMKGYILCKECGQYFGEDRVFQYVEHYQKEHLKAKQK